MKLLAKSDVVKAKGIDRQREIAEGVKLAKRVDSLREIAAEEEKSLNRFRTKTTEEIGKEILKLSLKRETLQGEVQLLERKRADALLPLDVEWKKVDAQKTINAEDTYVLNEREDVIKSAEKELGKRLEDVTKLEQRTVYAHDDASERLQKAAILHEEADQLKQAAGNTLSEALYKASIISADAAQRETFVWEREKSVANREEVVSTREATLEQDLIRLRDREETLKRNITRLK